MSLLEDKKKGSSTKASAKLRASSSKGASPIVAPGEGTTTPPLHCFGDQCLHARESLSLWQRNSLRGVISLVNKDEVGRLDLDRAISQFFHVVGQHAIGELKRMKEDSDATMARLESEIAELKKQSVLTKESVIEEYKSSDDFYEVVELATSRYFGEGFDFCKKKIGCLHPDLDIYDIGIDADLVEEEEEDEEDEEEKDEINNNSPP
ncbi:hypothetical protein Acr_00g0025600 [Actinidia rufa]|uniref:Uncharacterized protein n=1 Tax=Actinidia rufa TaxID=165716 RepID=A0A7J0DDQ3_9ERIC|nr:hypothetical protein Acr_00g0025600 [Actinidia rufa]